MKEKITRINRTLFELETGIVIFGAVCQLFVFLIEDKAAYSLGLWMGILVAGLSAFHMWWSLDRALELPERAAVKSMSTHNILRYVFITAVLALIAISGIAKSRIFGKSDPVHMSISYLRFVLTVFTSFSSCSIIVTIKSLFKTQRDYYADSEWWLQRCGFFFKPIRSFLIQIRF